MKKIGCLAIIFVFSFATNSQAVILWDNDIEIEEFSGYFSNSDISNGTTYDRRLLDDFIIPEEEIWEITDFHWMHSWDTASPGSGTGMNLRFLTDNSGAPDTEIAIANITSYTEIDTGVVLGINRDYYVAESEVIFDAITLGPGTYWWEGSIIGPSSGDNFWWRSYNVKNSPNYISYSDYFDYEFISSFDLTAMPFDLNFRITGQTAPIPEPTTMLLLGAGILGLAGLGRKKLFKKD